MSLLQEIPDLSDSSTISSKHSLSTGLSQEHSIRQSQDSLYFIPFFESNLEKDVLLVKSEHEDQTP